MKPHLFIGKHRSELRSATNNVIDRGFGMKPMPDKVTIRVARAMESIIRAELYAFRTGQDPLPEDMKKDIISTVQDAVHALRAFTM